MKKRGSLSAAPVTLGMALALVLSFVAMTAYTTGERTPDMAALTTGGDILDSEIGASKRVVWDNGMWWDDVIDAQYDWNFYPPLDPLPADDFMFTGDQLVNDVHWIGAYSNGPPWDGNFDWEIIFYNDFGDGTKPGTPIGTYTFPNAAVNETLIVGFPGVPNFFGYSVDLPAPLTFGADTKYWISIQGIGAYPPTSGWACHLDQILLHEAVFSSIYYGTAGWENTSDIFGYPYDMCFQLTYEGGCDWQPGDPHKMHEPQLPDEDGWDVNATHPMVLADDWQCSEEGWVKDIHFWGSWKNGIEGQVVSFWLSIHSNIPDPDGSGPACSMPGETLWEREIFNFDATQIDPPTLEGWYDPSTGEVLWDDHDTYFQYNICLDSADWFYQYQDTIYWLNISAVVADPAGTQWGWKSSENHFMDDAVWAYWGELDWIEIYEPGTSPDPITNEFWISIGSDGIPYAAGGTDYYDDGTSFYGWYYYPWSDWWNIWFYDHPLDLYRYKIVDISFDYSPGGPNAWADFAVNWSRETWPTGDPPPIPPFDPPYTEYLYLERDLLFFGLGTIPGHYDTSSYEILYCPEWVSIDVRGYSFNIQGEITHQCFPAQDTLSLDLAFVITGESNNPPYVPSNPSPPDGAIDQSINVDLAWSGGDPDPGNTVTYDIYFGDNSPPPLLVSDHHDTTYDPGTLVYETQYFWRIVARDPQGEETSGPEWDFTTGGTPVTCGDVNNDGIVDLSDAIWLLNYLFKSGPPPIPYMCVGDVNNDDAVVVGDAIYILNYLFKGGPPPDPNCCNPVWATE